MSLFSRIGRPLTGVALVAVPLLTLYALTPDDDVDTAANASVSASAVDGQSTAMTSEDLAIEDLSDWSYTKQDDKPKEPKKPKKSPKSANNGVGNGIDPQPPGNPPINDGPGTSPGNPGNKGGANK